MAKLTTRPTKAAFELVNKKWKIYRCLGGPLAYSMQDSSIPAGYNTIDAREFRRQQAIPAIHAHAHDLTLTETELGQLRRINETLLRYLNVAVIIIDRQYRILTINAAARRALGVRDLTSDLDFLHTVRGMPYQEVRHAIDNCFRERTTTMLDEIELDGSSEGSGRYLSLTIMYMQVEPGGPELAAITVVDATDQVQMKKRFEAVQLEHADLINELSGANKRFTAMNSELQDANEELQAANEELMLTQEELQATNEEFEATNEELQATNEELETNNEELQATNEELQTTNDELTARTGEFQELAKQHRLQQLQLTTVLERYPYYIMVLNAEDLTIQTINPAYKQLLGNRDVVGLPMTEVFSGKEVDELIKLLKRSVRERQPLETGPILANVDHGEKGIHFVHTVVPIVEASGSVAPRIFIYSEKAE